jgi:hypothetical protein
VSCCSTARSMIPKQGFAHSTRFKFADAFSLPAFPRGLFIPAMHFRRRTGRFNRGKGFDNLIIVP